MALVFLQAAVLGSWKQYDMIASPLGIIEQIEISKQENDDGFSMLYPLRLLKLLVDRLDRLLV